MKEGRITWRSVIVGLLFTMFFAVATVFLENRYSLTVTATQIAVLPYVLLIAAVMMINPICRLIRFIRPFTQTEVLLVFVMTSVSAGISTFGLASQLVPVMSSFYNEHWNNDQSEWDLYVEPYINDAYFLSEDGIQEAAEAYRDSVLAWEKARESGMDEAGLAALEAERLAKKEALQKLEEKAFDRVETFRRGLPRGQRAFPGIVKLPDESWALYRARFGRLVHGRPALKDALAAEKTIQTNGMAGGKEEAAKRLQSAIERLGRLSSTAELEAVSEELGQRWTDANEKGLEIDNEIQTLLAESRAADPDTRSELESRAASLRRKLHSAQIRKRDLTREQEAVKTELATVAQVKVTIGELEQALGLVTATPPGDQAETLAVLGSAIDHFRGFDATLTRYLLGDVPWGLWVRPLIHWGIVLALSYTILMTFNVLIFRQWAHNERLIFPLAQLPEVLAGAEGGQIHQGWVPPVFRNGLFWIGFAIAGGTMGWNLVASTGWVPGLPEIPLGKNLSYWVAGSQFAPLQPGTKVSIFFTMIGLAFLIPAEISFSLWFFWVVYLVQLLLVVWTGHGVNESSFSSDWYNTLNFRTAEAFGALIVFSMVVLWKCRRYLLCGFNTRMLSGVEPGERLELRTASVLFVACSVGLVLMLWLSMGANLAYTIFVYLVVLMLTIGLVRAVAEGGLLGFQAWVSPFHFIRTVFGMDKAWTAPGLFAPLVVFYSILFLDIKTFIAPAMANSLKVRDDLKMRRLWFHVSVVLAIVAAVGVALGMHIMMAYNKGGDAMSSWFYTSFPKGMFNTIASWGKTLPTDSTACNWWLVVGAVAMMALLIGRMYIFWLPHPIGMIMLVNPIMHAYWTSIFLGWLGKKLATKYGNKETYKKIRGLFIGLIAGELMVVILSALLSYVTENHLGVTLNRN